MGTRKFSRVNFNVEAVIKSGDRSFCGEVKNLSMTGMFLETDEQMDDEEVVEITISLTGSMPEIVIGFSGKVARQVENGLAFVFDKIDLDSYMHLRNIVSYNIDDSEKVMEEICVSIDEKLSKGN